THAHERRPFRPLDIHFEEIDVSNSLFFADGIERGCPHRYSIAVSPDSIRVPLLSILNVNCTRSVHYRDVKRHDAVEPFQPAQAGLLTAELLGDLDWHNTARPVPIAGNRQ